MSGTLGDLTIKIPFFYFLFGFFLIALAVFFYFRIGSSFSVKGRLYGFVVDRSDFYNEEIKCFWKDRKDVERFNALFNINAKSVKEVVGFKGWVEKYDLNILSLTNLKGRVDLKKMSVKRKSNIEIAVLLVFLIVIFFAMSFFLSISVSNSALLKFNDDDQWFWLNHDRARSHIFEDFIADRNEWVITKIDCENGFEVEEKASEIGMSEKNINNICRSFENEKDIAKIDEFIKNQKWFFILSMISLFFMLLPYFELARILKSIEARREIYFKYVIYRKNNS